MKPFNLERAKAGDPICSASGQIHYFVGVRRDGAIVTELGTGGYVSSYQPNDLFMAPKKRTVWVNLYSNAHAIHFYTEEQANSSTYSINRIGGKAYPVEIDA